MSRGQEIYGYIELPEDYWVYSNNEGYEIEYEITS